MKTTLIILLTLLLTNTLVATELDWVDEQIAAIKPPRKGVVVAGVENPFVFLNKNKPKETKKGAASVPFRPSAVTKTASADAKSKEKEPVKRSSFELSAIINSSALINGNWYKKSDVVKNYKISEISRDSVTLKKGDKILLLSTATKKQTLKFKNK